jgi:hypothetical protein
MTQSLYELSLADYLKLEESGNGKLIYSSEWPANVSVFKSMKSRYLAVKQMYSVIEDVSGATGCSAEDLIGVVLAYSELFEDIRNDVENGVISQEDIEAMINYIDGVEEE